MSRKNKNNKPAALEPVVDTTAPDTTNTSAAVLEPAASNTLSAEEQAAAQAALSATQQPDPAQSDTTGTPAALDPNLANNSVPAVQPSKRDAFGGRLGTRMSNINLVVINAGATGATIAEVAAATGETKSLVSSQLSWMVTQGKGASRKEEIVNGKKQFRYYAANVDPNQLLLVLN